MKTRIKLGSVLLLSSILLLYPVSLGVHIFLFVILLFVIVYKKLLSSYLPFVQPLGVALVLLVLLQTVTFSGTRWSREGFELGILSASRILSLSSMVFIFMQTTALRDFLTALHFLPLSIRFSLAIGFGLVSLLSTELRKIVIARSTRGHRKSWNMMVSYGPYIVPLIAKSFIRARKLALSLQARGYRG